MKWLVPFVVLFLASLNQAQDSRAYSDERAKVKFLTDQQLIDCLRGPKSCALGAQYYDVNHIKRALADRRHPGLIIAAYKKADEVDRYVLVRTLWLMDDPDVETFMRSIAFDYRGDGSDDSSGFFALDYLAQRCDLRALARLNRDVNFKTYTAMAFSTAETLSDVWNDTIQAFGRCNYVPAAQNLVRSLNSGCPGTEQSPRLILGNSGCLSTDKAEQSLEQIFPGDCSNRRSVEEKQQCYETLSHPSPKTTNH